MCRQEVLRTECQWIVAEIIGRVGSGRNIKYIVRWEAGHNPAETVEPLECLKNAQKMLEQWRKRRHALAQKRYRIKLKQLEARNLNKRVKSRPE